MYIELLDKNSNFYTIRENKHPKWVDKKIHEVLKILKERSFFKRFKISRIREMLDEMCLKVID